MSPALRRLPLLACLLWGTGACAQSQPAVEVRRPAVAGQFYPADGEELRAAVDAFWEDALPPAPLRPIALVVPHAGYIYSGQVAADAYRQAEGGQYDVVVVIGTNHTTPGYRGVSVDQASGHRTPLGVLPADAELSAALAAADPLFAYRPEVHQGEHSVEVQLPFVQARWPSARVVAAVVGGPDPEVAARFGRAVARLVRDRRALVVASSDLSHYPPAAQAAQVDAAVLSAVASLDPAAVVRIVAQELDRGVPNLATCACGEGAVLAAMAAASELGARRGRVVRYAHSGWTAFGEDDRVVGYGAVAFDPGEGGPDTAALAVPAAEDGSGPHLALADREYLLRLARATVTRYLTSHTVPLPRLDTPGLARRQGAFVTLKKAGALRGCIGHMAEDTPLALTVTRMALQAALRDQRFTPVRRDELADLEVEVSVLTPFTAVAGPQAVVVGRDGVLLEKSGHRAVFLPQVAPEQGWDRDEMLGQLCQKGGLPADCWQEGARLSTFQAEVFAEAAGH
ncbi:MAG: AmmeMemoRadiSam system protein B [Candidatus Latescibacterota bacterium]